VNFSSWKELTSSVITSSPALSTMAANAGLMFPRPASAPTPVQHSCHQFRRRRFAIGSGDCYDRPTAKTIGKFQFADDLDFLRVKFRTSCAAGSIPGLRIPRSYRAGSPSAAAPRAARCCARYFSAAARSLSGAALSSSVTPAPSCASRRAAATPLSPAPSTAIFFRCNSLGYRSFKVARPKNANMIERIQNRTITVFSFQPFNSK